MPVFARTEAEFLGGTILREVPSVDKSSADDVALRECTACISCCFDAALGVTVIRDAGFGPIIGRKGFITYTFEAGRSALGTHRLVQCSDGDRANLSKQQVDYFNLGLAETDGDLALQNHALETVTSSWGMDIRRERCRVYGERAERRVKHPRGHDYSPPSTGWVGIPPTMHGNFNGAGMDYHRIPPQAWECHLDTIIHIAINNLEADEDEKVAYHGLTLHDDAPLPSGTWRGSLQPPVLETARGAHKLGVYLTPSFRMAASYGFRRWTSEERFSRRGPNGYCYLAVFACAVGEGKFDEHRGTAFSHNDDGWKTNEIEWVVRKPEDAKIHAVIMCYFKPRWEVPQLHLQSYLDLKCVAEHRGVGYSANDGAFTFDGKEAFARMRRSVQDDFTVTFDFATSHPGSNDDRNWFLGCGLVDAEVAGVRNDFGLSVGKGRLMFGIGRPDTTITSHNRVDDGLWHTVNATREMKSGRFALQLNGEVVSTKVGNTKSLTAPRFIDVGRIQTGRNYFTGKIRNVYISGHVQRNLFQEQAPRIEEQKPNSPIEMQLPPIEEQSPNPGQPERAMDEDSASMCVLS